MRSRGPAHSWSPSSFYCSHCFHARYCCARESPMTNMQTVAATTPAAHVIVEKPAKLAARNLDFFYGDYRALKSINMDVAEKHVTAIIGPSGCGKSTLLRIFNRIYSIYPKLRAEGEVILDGENVL